MDWWTSVKEHLIVLFILACVMYIPIHHYSGWVLPGWLPWIPLTVVVGFAVLFIVAALFEKGSW